MILLLMVFLHIVDDFYLQRILASMKQKSWWIKQEGYKELYKHDYVMALFMHAFSWTFMVMLPIAYCMNWEISVFFGFVFVWNTVVHMVIDHLKANKGLINLVQDQTIHLGQICATFALFVGGWM